MDFAASSVFRKRLDAADIGLCGAFAHHHADQRAGELGLAVGAHQSSLAELVGGPAIQDHDIGDLASRKPRGNGLRRVTHRWTARGDQMVTARALESRTQLGIDSIKAGRDHHLHIGGGSGPHRQQRGHADHG